MKRKILITGGAGNLGSSLTNSLLLENNNHVVVIDNLLTGNTDKLDKRDNLQFYNADVNSYQAMSEIMKSHSFDLVFHYAAIVGVERTLKNPIEVLKDIDGIKNILDLSLDADVQRVFFSSSSEVYGEPVEIPLNEQTTPLNSRLPYAIVKNVGEAYFRSYKKIHALDYTIMRFFNTYGPLQSEDFVIPKFVKCALNNDVISINGDGSQTRTFLYIDDNLNFITSMINNNQCINSTVNVGSDEEITVLDLAKLIIKITGSTSRIEHLPPLKEGDMTRRKPDIKIMKSVIDEDLLPVEQGIIKYLEHI